MRRIFFMSLFAITLCCFGVPMARGYTLVQSNGTTGDLSVGVSFTTNNTAGNLIIVSAAWENGGIASVSDIGAGFSVDACMVTG